MTDALRDDVNERARQADALVWELRKATTKRWRDAVHSKIVLLAAATPQPALDVPPEAVIARALHYYEHVDSEEQCDAPMHASAFRTWLLKAAREYAAAPSGQEEEPR